jgi:hypothetical protein
MPYTLQNIADFIPDVLGLCGVFIILWYYFLLQVGKCNSESLVFSAANFIGSILLLISLWFNWNLASVIVEIAWLMISLYGIFKHLYKSRLVN